MSDYELPDLPSDKELGIDGDDLEEFLDEDGNLREDALEAKLKAEFEEAQKAKAAGKAPTTSKKSAPKKKAAAKPGWLARRRARRKEKAEARRAAKAPADKPAQKAGGNGEAEAEKSTPAGATEAVGPPTKPEGLRRWRGPVTLALLALMALAASPRWFLPPTAPASAPTSEFSSARAMVELTDLARAPHPTGSPEHTRVREAVVARLTAMGLDPVVDSTTSIRRMGRRAQAATVRNILARIPGTSSSGAVLLTAHYDSRGLSHGAADDGVGVVAILEAVRAFLDEGTPPANDVIVLITDAEELGLLGATAFVDQHPWFEDVAVVLSVEMRGAGGPSLMFETGAENGWMVRQYQASSPHPWANSFSVEVYRRLPNDTDFSPFRDRGVQGLNFAGIGRASIYHQVSDQPDNVQEATIQHHGSQVLAALRHLGSEDLSSVDAPDVIYFTFPIVGLVVYPQSYALFIGGGLLLLFAAAVFVSRGASGGWKGIGVGFLLGLLSMAGSGAAGWALWRWIQPRHAELGGLQGSALYNEGAYLLGLTAVSLALVLIVFSVARRYARLADLTLGALVVPVLLALAVTVVAPLAAANLQWPVVAAVLAAVVTLGVAPRRAPGWGRWILLMVLALPVVVFLGPLLELTWVSMSLAIAPVLAATAAMIALLLLPQLDAVREPNVWWAPALLVLGGAGLVGLGLSTAATSVERPLPTTLLFAYDHVSGEAFWASPEGRSIGWAESQVGTLEQERTLDRFLALGPTSYRVTPAASPTIAPPRVAFLSESVEMGRRRVRVAVSSVSGAERLDLQMEGNGSIVAVNGFAVPDSATASLNHWGVPPSGWLFLDVEQPAPGSPANLRVTEVHHRPTELIGGEFFSRPPELTADVTTLTDVALLRSTVTIGPPGQVAVDPAAAEIEALHAGGEVPARDTLPPTTDTVATPATSVVPDTSGTPDSVAVDTVGVGGVAGGIPASSDTLAEPTDTAGVQADSAATSTDTVSVDTTSSPFQTAGRRGG